MPSRRRREDARSRPGNAGVGPIMNTLLTQAAAEYVGVAMQTLLRDMGNGLRSAGRYFENNPITLVALVVVLLVLMRLLGRRRR